MKDITRLIATGVMGWEVKTNKYTNKDYYYLSVESLGELPPGNYEIPRINVEDFSSLTNWNDTLMVVEQVKDDWYEIGWLAGLYRVQFTQPNMKASEQLYHEHTDKDLQLAICLAALQAMGVKL